LAELTDAVAENAHQIANAFEEVGRALAKFGAKSNKELTGALDRLSKQLLENQHSIMRAINSKIDGKPVEEAKNVPAKVH
jgi:acyl-CoA reductase-like NAD-dependent aldehyde dehydrogenase